MNPRRQFIDWTYIYERTATTAGVYMQSLELVRSQPLVPAGELKVLRILAHPRTDTYQGDILS